MLYRVSLQAGEKLYLEGRSVTGGTVGWRLIDPYGDLAASSSSVIGPVTPFTVAKTGDYWLALDGASGNGTAQSVSLEFVLNRVPDLAAMLVVGDAVTGALSAAGQSVVYTFTLNAASQLVFDSQSNRSDLFWSLRGPRGSEITDRRFDSSDADATVSNLSLPAGDYRLSVRGSGNATGAYAFRLLDAAAAPELVLGTATTGALAPGNATHLYRLHVAAGDQLAFDSLSVAGGPATWRLLDSYGRDVLGTKDLAVDQTAFPLATPGAYTLLVEGRAGNTAAVGYGFQFNYVGNLPQAGLPAGNPMALGSVVADSLATTGTSKVYRFTLAQDSVLLFDTQTTSSNFTWSLAGPRGQEVNDVSLYASDSGYGNPVQALPAGDYALTVKAQYGSGAYAFRLLDASDFPLLTLGEQVSVSRSPANSTLGYRFSASVGETFVITRQSGDGYWRVVDPYGKVVFGQYYDYTSTPFTASATGIYTLINEGTYYQSGSVSTRFRLDKQIGQTEALVLNDKVTGSLAGAHESDQYSFTLTAPTTLVLDVLESPSARADTIGWTITGSGASNRSLSRNDPVTLAPGQYTLTVRGSDSLAHDYQFRMLTREVATPLAQDMLASGVLTPEASTLLYRFDGAEGQVLYLDGQDASASYSYSYWRLTDAFGKSVASGYTYSGSSPFTLPSTGEYLLSVQYSFRDDTASQRAFSLHLIPETTRLASLALNVDVAGSIGQPNERVRYAFTLGGPTTVLVDTWGADSKINWSLQGPRGSEAQETP